MEYIKIDKEMGNGEGLTREEALEWLKQNYDKSERTLLKRLRKAEETILKNLDNKYYNFEGMFSILAIRATY